MLKVTRIEKIFENCHGCDKRTYVLYMKEFPFSPIIIYLCQKCLIEDALKIVEMFEGEAKIYGGIMVLIFNLVFGDHEVSFWESNDVLDEWRQNIVKQET